MINYEWLLNDDAFKHFCENNDIKITQLKSGSWSLILLITVELNNIIKSLSDWDDCKDTLTEVEKIRDFGVEILKKEYFKDYDELMFSTLNNNNLNNDVNTINESYDNALLIKKEDFSKFFKMLSDLHLEECI